MVHRLVLREDMIKRFGQLVEKGWISSNRPISHGGIGNTIDELLGFPENNLPVADSAQWELKTHRLGSSSLVTLFHVEPQPRSERIVPRLLLPNYGWPDQRRENELSFRQTLNALQFTDRGFTIVRDHDSHTVRVAFDASRVGDNHRDWLLTVQQRIGLGQLNPQPNWEIQDLALRVSTKMLNSFYVEAETARSNVREYFRVHSVLMLQGFDTGGFVRAIDEGGVYVDFDARTHHNHGTKFRLRDTFLPTLYSYRDQVA